MRVIINESQLFEIIKGEYNELKTKIKPIVGSGAEHRIFVSKRDPNIIYKIGSINVVKKWYEIFKKYPDFFPKVYKIGITNVPIITEPDGKYRMAYVAIEKLDTETFEKNWNIFDEYFDYNMSDIIITSLSTDFVFDQLVSAGEMIRQNEGEEMYLKYKEIIDLCVNINKVIYKSLDVHIYNFGYDRNGKLKCLDI